MDDLGIRKLEMRGRETSTSASGAMTIRRFYIEPFEAFEKIIEAVEGYVTTGDEGYVRYLPANDCYFRGVADKEPLMFASEVRVLPVDRDDVSISNVDSMSRKNWKSIEELRSDMTKLDFKEKNKGGAFVEVIYRPEISAIKNKTIPYPPGPDTSKLFDYLDPQFKSKTIYLASPDGLLCPTGSFNLHSNYINVPPEMVSPIPLNIVDFTIRRSLVPSIPWDTISECIGKVNKGGENHDKPLKFAGTTLPASHPLGPEPTYGFPPLTLKFNGPISIKRGISSSKGSKEREWFEIIYWFEWINQKTDDLWTFDGRHYAGASKLKKISGNITWQDAFLSPKWQPFGILDDGALGQTGWFPLYRRKIEDTGLGFKVGAPSSPIYEETDDFQKLFDINSR